MCIQYSIILFPVTCKLSSSYFSDNSNAVKLKLLTKIKYSYIVIPPNSLHPSNCPGGGWVGNDDGLLTVPSTYLESSEAKTYCACSRCRWGLFGNFFISSYFFFICLFLKFFPGAIYLSETAWYRLKYCLKELLNPKQPNQIQLPPALWIYIRISEKSSILKV